MACPLALRTGGQPVRRAVACAPAARVPCGTVHAALHAARKKLITGLDRYYPYYPQGEESTS
jgi:hypothetical protein